MADFDTSVAKVIEREQYKANEPDDRGGLTIWGISSRIFPREVAKMEKMSKENSLKFAVKLYRKKYWDKNNLGQVQSQEMADKLLDLGVHAGSNTAGRILQRTLNEHGAQLELDGGIGPKTLEALNAHADNVAPILSGIVSKQIRYYKQIIRNNPSQRKFKNNWIKRAQLEDEPLPDQKLKVENPDMGIYKKPPVPESDKGDIKRFGIQAPPNVRKKDPQTIEVKETGHKAPWES